MFLKYLIPFDRFVIRSPLSPVEAAECLQDAVEPWKLRVWKGSKAFEGKVEGGRFKITRMIGYRNSFLPVIVGRIEPAPGGCTIYIHMRMIVFVMAFCAVWFGAAFSVGLAMLKDLTLERLQTQPTLLIPVGMLIFFLVLVNGGFWFEANKQKRMLRNLFRAVDVQGMVI